jgi:hypothetical protein
MIMRWHYQGGVVARRGVRSGARHQLESSVLLILAIEDYLLGMETLSCTNFPRLFLFLRIYYNGK